jgi:hypothetical protein
MDVPRKIPIEPGVVRPVHIAGAERIPGAFSVVMAVWIPYTALSTGNYEILWLLLLVALWHWMCRLAAQRDPQYLEILFRELWSYPWPEYLAGAEGIYAKEVRQEPAVPG